MKKKLLSIIIASLAIVACALGLTACKTETCKNGTIPHQYVNGVCSMCGEQLSISEGLEYTLNEDNESYSVSGIGTCTETRLNIPKEYNSKPVTKIGSEAFRYCSELTYISIPDGVTGIGDYAFDDCSALKSMAIPDSVTEIGNYVFEDCSELTSVKIPDSIAKISWAMFSGCSKLTSIKIPDNVTSISGYSFYNCSALTSVNIPDGVTHINDRAFYGCSSLKSISIPDGVTFIGELAFKSCSSLKSISLPDSVTHVGKGLFFGCTNITDIQLGSKITSFPCFEDYTYSSGGFIIGITHRFNGFFGNCNSLKTITFTGTKEQWNKIDKDNYWDYNTGNYTVICTDGKINKPRN